MLESFFFHVGTLCSGRWTFIQTIFSISDGGLIMDDYQEELLEYQAFELDPLEPAEDATEL
ncbi:MULTISPECIES: hypothetical protein [unclassified Pseudomonas]|uniref:hypothetical protein n=1 Tax=unclassified Pseudomonas TaxID=196821 RepID=UPI00215E61B5|nr:hypothetical protein [Pseudomonas sp. B21-015]UVM52438.1 hypothetical protein LOY38_10570 [Pseudomonas sp. B21-015]